MFTKVVLMSGIPGSGKSTHVDRFATDDSVICSADKHFIGRDGVYRFNPAELSTAHAKCLRLFVHILAQLAEEPNLSCDYLIVDNTNLSALELAPYVQVAAAYGVPVEIITVHCEPHVAFARCTHNVPMNSIIRMCDTLNQRELPPYWNVQMTEIDN